MNIGFVPTPMLHLAHSSSNFTPISSRRCAHANVDSRKRTTFHKVTSFTSGCDSRFFVKRDLFAVREAKVSGEKSGRIEVYSMAHGQRSPPPEKAERPDETLSYETPSENSDQDRLQIIWADYMKAETPIDKAKFLEGYIALREILTRGSATKDQSTSGVDPQPAPKMQQLPSTVQFVENAKMSAAHTFDKVLGLITSMGNPVP